MDQDLEQQSLLACPDPFACLKCRRGFADRDSLKKHQKSDCLTVPHVCSDCQKEYCSEGNLKRHVASVHQGIRPFVCPVCGNMFTQKGHMTAHLVKVHAQDKTAFALAGGKGAPSGTDKDKSFVCDICDQGFTAKGNLKRHMLKHTDLKPFCCLVCGQGFSQKVHMLNHMEKRHNIMRPPPRPAPPKATQFKFEFVDVPAETLYSQQDEENSRDSGVFSVTSSTPYEMPFNEGLSVSSTSSYEVPYPDDQPMLPVVDELAAPSTGGGGDWEVDMLQQACFDLGLMEEDQDYTVKDFDLVTLQQQIPSGFNDVVTPAAEDEPSPYVTVNSSEPVVKLEPSPYATMNSSGPVVKTEPPAVVMVVTPPPPPPTPVHGPTNAQFFGGNLAYGCNRCTASYSDVKQLQKHLRETHNYQQARDKKGNDRKGNPADEVYRCRLCGRAFEWAQSMTRHMRTHTGERPYECRASPDLGPVCNRRWIHLESEKRHRRACLEASVQVNSVSSTRPSPAHYTAAAPSTFVTRPSPVHLAVASPPTWPPHHQLSNITNGVKTIDCEETKPVIFDLDTNQVTVVNQ